MRLSEKDRRSLQRNTTEHPKALFALRIPAKSTLYALRMHLFGQSLYSYSDTQRKRAPQRQLEYF